MLVWSYLDTGVVKSCTKKAASVIQTVATVAAYPLGLAVPASGELLQVELLPHLTPTREIHNLFSNDHWTKILCTL